MASLDDDPGRQSSGTYPFSMIGSYRCVNRVCKLLSVTTAPFYNILSCRRYACRLLRKLRLRECSTDRWKARFQETTYYDNLRGSLLATREHACLSDAIFRRIGGVHIFGAVNRLVGSSYLVSGLFLSNYTHSGPAVAIKLIKRTLSLLCFH